MASNLIRNFYSDTQTLPTRAMRETVLTAEVGDEQSGRDPTTTLLCERMADLLGKEAAVFLPSGTMANEIAIAVHCRPGDEILCHRVSHIIEAEGGGPAALSGVMLNPLDGPGGQFTADQVIGAVRTPTRYHPKTRLLEVEQTVNLAGGRVWPVEDLDAVAAAAKAAGLATHMDGARLMNAVIAGGQPAAAHAAGYDSVWLDFTKGLGAPIGAVLAGSEDFIHAAWQFKQMWGGAMRQSGIAAAMCLYALDNHVDRLDDDHVLAGWIGAEIGAMAGVAEVLPVETNIVIFDLRDTAPDAATLVAALAEDGLRIGAFGPRRIRILTHLDVDRDDAEGLITALARHLT